MTEQKFPPGWDAARVERLIAHYEDQDEEVQVAEDEAAHQSQDQAVMVVPLELVPAIRQMIAQKSGS
jgi:predicted dinucleotide-binding enzyme